MFGTFLSRAYVCGVNWIIRRIGVGIALVAIAAVIVGVVAVAGGFDASGHQMQTASGILWGRS
jgi:hypothetical protein